MGRLICLLGLLVGSAAWAEMHVIDVSSEKDERPQADERSTQVYRTENFLVTARAGGNARELAEAAEKLRKDIAIEWLGKELPRSERLILIDTYTYPTPRLGNGGGNTNIVFDSGVARNFAISVQGTGESLIDSVLPHEILHTVLASHFGRPLPRWADEGACTTMECEAERNKHRERIGSYIKWRRTFPLSQLVGMTQYPDDVMPLYTQGHSLVEFLLTRKPKDSRKTFLAFLDCGLKNGKWDQAVKKHYGYDNVEALEDAWLASLAAK